MDCLILEDQVLIADLLRNDLERIPGLRIVAVAHGVDEGKRLCRLHRPNLLLLDLVMPDGLGVEVADTLLTLKPEARLVVLSGQCERLVCSRHVHAAVLAVVDKTAEIDILHEIIQREMKRVRGGTSDTDPLEQLTNREREVLALIGRGNSTEVIAERLGISLFTARTHRRNITAKLGMKGAELVLLASGRMAPKS